MEFLITKTSNYWDLDGNMIAPHPDAYQKKYDRIEGRTCTEDYFDRHFGEREGLWRSKGVDHMTTENGKHIQRRHIADNDGWFIKMKNLQDLIDFVKENGSIVLQESGNFLEMEIYNGYRE